MRFSFVVAVLALALAACGESAQAPEQLPPEAIPELAPGQPLDLSCAEFANASIETLTQRFGAENIVNQTLPGPEGENYEATLIYPDDPGRRLEVHWTDAATRGQISEVSVSGELSDWRGPNGLVLGQAMDDVERLNGKPFQVLGFGWDYGGNVSNWMDGAFAPRDGCIIRAQFYTASQDTGIMGEAPRMSDVPAMRAAEPRVSQIGIAFPAPQ